MVGVIPCRLDTQQWGYAVPAQQSGSTYTRCWTPEYVEQMLNNLVRDIGSDVATIGLTPERLEAILERVRAKEFRARYGA